jgi:hypothetical protein
MLVNMERQHKFTPRTTTMLPTWGQWKVAGGVAWAERPYERRTQLMPLLRELGATTCVGVSSGFWVLPYVHPDRVRLQNALRPAPAQEAVIRDFMSRVGRKFLGVHLRLTDLGHANATHCERDMRATFQVMRTLMDEHALGTVALATDDYGSLCARQLMTTFPDTVRVESGVHPVDSCSEAQFVHEVLARGACFIGTLNSTMSATVEDIRRSDRAHNTTTPPCTIRLAAGQTVFQW